jgi:hypothetical protein
VTIEIVKPDSSKDDGGTTTDAGGSLSSSYDLAADADAGTYKVKILDPSTSDTLANTDFTVEAAGGSSTTTTTTSAPPCGTGNEQLATDDPSYAAGDTVHVTGSGFGPQCPVDVRVTRPDGSTSTSSVTTDFSSSFGYHLTLGAEPAAGSYTVDALGDNGDTLASTSFQVETASGAQCGKLGTENVDTNHSEYQAGATVKVTGSGYAHLCAVSVEITRPDGTVVKSDGTLGSDTGTTNVGGSFAYTYQLPSLAQPGGYTIGILGLGDEQLATATFTVAQPIAAFVSTDQPDYAPGENVTLTGGGFQPGERVTIVYHRQSDSTPDTTLSSSADANGGFTNSAFTLIPEDGGIVFTVTATGASSGATATAEFNDSTSSDCFRTVASGNWSSTSTWESAPTVSGCTVWSAATLTPTSGASTVTIRGGNTVHVTAAVTVDQVTVDSGGDLEIDSGQTVSLANGSGNDLTVNGTLGIAGSLVNVSSQLPDAVVSGSMSVPTGGSVNFASNGSFTFNSGATLTIASDATFNGGGQNAALTLNSGASATAASAITGFGQVRVDGTLTTSANLTLPSVSNLQVGGTLTMTGGTLSVTRGNGGSVGSVNNGGTIALQNSTAMTIGTVSTAHFDVASGGTLNLGPSVVASGSAFLSVASGANLVIGSSDGLVANTLNGNVRTGRPTADVEVDPDGFYFAGPLPKNVVWTVQVCNGGTQVALRKVKGALALYDFDEEDFYL